MSRSPVLTLGGICVLPIVNCLQDRAFDSTCTYGRRAFSVSVAGPTVWNSVPDFIQDLAISADDNNALSALEVLEDNSYCDI